MSPVSVAAIHWWAFGILCHPRVPFCACLHNRSAAWQEFLSLCSTCCVSLNAAAPALSCWPALAAWGVAYAVTPAALSLHDVTHMLPSVSLRFSTTHGCVCSMGLSCPWSVFPKCAEWVFRSPERYCTWVDLLPIRCLARLTVLTNVKIVCNGLLKKKEVLILTAECSYYTNHSALASISYARVFV